MDWGFKDVYRQFLCSLYRGKELGLVIWLIKEEWKYIFANQATLIGRAWVEHSFPVDHSHGWQFNTHRNTHICFCLVFFSTYFFKIILVTLIDYRFIGNIRCWISMSHYLFLNEGFEFICLSSFEDSGSFSRAGQKSGEGAGKNTLLQTFRTLSIIFIFIL